MWLTSVILFLYFLVCTAKIDLGFLIDASTTVLRSRSQNYQQVVKFLRGLLRYFKVSKTTTRFGIVAYSSRTSTVISFSRAYTRRQIYKAVLRLKELGGRRQLGKALTYARTHLFRGKPQCGRRRILIVLTAGGSVDQVRGPSMSLLASGVEIFMIGVGRVSNPTLFQVATDRRHAFVIGFQQLYTIAKTLKDNICFSSGKAALWFFFL